MWTEVHLEDRTVKIQQLLIILTIANIGLLTLLLVRSSSAEALSVAPVLRGRAFEIVDDHGRVRASITVVPAEPNAKMPDGTTGYPETVLFRMTTSKGRPNVKIAATEDGSVLSLGGDSDPTYASLNARGASTSLKLVNKNGRQQEIKP
jgi:hypothetical protein